MERVEGMLQEILSQVRLDDKGTEEAIIPGGQRFGLDTPMNYDREVLWGFLQVLPKAMAQVDNTPSHERNASTHLDDLTTVAETFDIEREISKAGLNEYFTFRPGQARQMLIPLDCIASMLSTRRWHREQLHPTAHSRLLGAHRQPRPRRCRGRRRRKYVTVRGTKAHANRRLREMLSAARAERHELYAAIRLVAYTGLRRGEAPGLLWGNVHLDMKRVYVEASLVRSSGRGLLPQPPKTAAGLRTVDIDEGTALVLSDHLRDQGRLKCQMRQAADAFAAAMERDDAPRKELAG